MSGPEARPRPGVRRGAGLVLAAALAGAPPAAARTFTIVIDHLAFGPPPAALRVGDTVEWVNQDLFRHTATARDGGFDFDLPPKARARMTIRRPGVVNVYCRYHPGMTQRLAIRR